METKPFEIKFLPPPPDYIYKFRQRRQAPAKSIMEGQGGMYIPDADTPEDKLYVEGKGTFVYYRGFGDMPAPAFPQRNMTPEDSVYSISPVKRNVINILRLLSSREMRVPMVFSLIAPKRWRAKLLNKVLALFNHTADVTLTPYYMKDGYYCDLVRQMRKFIGIMLEEFGVDKEVASKTAEVIGMLFEFDWGYRWPTQDAFTECDPKALIENLPKELDRLVKILEGRWDQGVTDMGDKFRAGTNLLKYAWYIPSIRKSIRKAISAMDIEKCKLDEGEIYHTLLYGTYNVQGKSLAERIKIYEGYHGSDQTKWPPRVVIHTKQ